MKRKKYLRDSKVAEFLENSYIGEVVDIDDPDYVGRCKIKVYGIYADKDGKIGNLAKEDIPWAYPVLDKAFGAKGGGRLSVPKIGTKVRVIFENDQYHPKYVSIEHLDARLKELAKGDYKNFHGVLVDSDVKLEIFFAQKSGFVIALNEATFNISTDGTTITLYNKGSQATMEFNGSDIDIVTKSSVNVSSTNNITINSNSVHVNGTQTDVGANPIFAAVNGEPLFVLLSALGTMIDSKYPLTPGAAVNLINTAKDSCLSKTVTTTP
jgi:hypothetical protein